MCSQKKPFATRLNGAAEALPGVNLASPGQSRAVQGKVQGDVSLYFCGAPLVCGSIGGSKAVQLLQADKTCAAMAGDGGVDAAPSQTANISAIRAAQPPVELSVAHFSLRRSLALLCGSSNPYNGGPATTSGRGENNQLVRSNCDASNRVSSGLQEKVRIKKYRWQQKTLISALGARSDCSLSTPSLRCIIPKSAQAGRGGDVDWVGKFGGLSGPLVRIAQFSF
jgi:hypothetical protein